MKNSIFQNYCYQYASVNWGSKKEKINKWIDEAIFQRDQMQTFLSDRDTNNDKYLEEFSNLFKDEITLFSNELGRPVKLQNLWLVKYEKGDWHPPHTHGSTGFSGIIFVDYDEKEHTPPYFIDPINDRFTDRTNYIIPNVFEGDIVLMRSNVLHFTYPNLSEKQRVILGFDVDVI